MTKIGHKVKALRIKNGLTLEELASRTELTKGFLSQLERDLTSPSLKTLEYICEALGMDLATFFAEETSEKFVFTEEDVFVDKRDDQTLTWIVPNAQKNKMEPLMLELLPGAKSMTIDPHEGEEMGYVLQGKVWLYQGENTRPNVVRHGETFYIKGNESHYLANQGKTRAVVLWISTPPVF